MANLDVVDRIANSDTRSLTLVIRDTDNPDDPGAYYHYAAEPPKHSELSADQWVEQVAGHALALEARSRGVDPPARAHPEPGQLGAAADQLGAAERVELENLRAARTAADQAARDRAELEQLRASRQAGNPAGQPSDQEQPTA